MRLLLFALIPGTIVYVYFFGYGMLFNFLIACLFAASSEAIILLWRKKPVVFFLKDYSAIVTAILLALCLPSLAPWWLVAIATLFAIIIGKHLYGGLGQNLFNPAMIGYVVVMISFPQIMTTQWLDASKKIKPGLLDTYIHQTTPHKPVSNKTVKSNSKGTAHLKIDSITSATPLDKIKSELDRGKTISELNQSRLFGTFASKGWEWVNLFFLFGGLWLLYRKIISWHIPVAMLGSMLLLALVFNTVDSDNYLSPVFQLFSGGAMLGAFFIATDPVTSPATHRGKIYFGVGVGIFTYVIRTWGGYPDGIAFAVLLMNMATPTLDYYTQPDVFGHQKKSQCDEHNKDNGA